MVLTEWTASLVVETLPFKVLLAVSTVEALTVIIVIQSFYPSVAGLNGESASKAFSGEELVPISFTICHAFLQEEWSVAKQFSAMATSEALWMEVPSNSIQAIALDFAGAFAASRSQVLLETVLAVQISLFLDESNVLQWATAIGVYAHEVIWAPDAT